MGRRSSRMGVDRNALEPEPAAPASGCRRSRWRSCRETPGGQRASERAPMIRAASSPSVASNTCASCSQFSMCTARRLAGHAEAPVVVHLHRHERRDVESPWRSDSAARAGSRRVAASRARSVALAPRRVGDFGDDGLDARVRGVEAVVEAHRVEAVAEVAQVREQADGPARPHARFAPATRSRTASSSGTAGSPRWSARSKPASAGRRVDQSQRPRNTVSSSARSRYIRNSR